MIWILSYLVIGCLVYASWYTWQGSCYYPDGDTLVFVCCLLGWPLIFTMLFTCGLCLLATYSIQLIVDAVKKLC